MIRPASLLVSFSLACSIFLSLTQAHSHQPEASGKRNQYRKVKRETTEAPSRRTGCQPSHKKQSDLHNTGENPEPNSRKLVDITPSSNEKSTSQLTSLGSTSASGTTKVSAGTAFYSDFFAKEAVLDIIIKNFQFITPANDMKWDTIQPSPGVFNFDKADKIVDFALKNKIKVKGHTAVYKTQVPAWLQSLDGPALIKATQDHLMTLFKHYGNKLYSFDVVNEMIGDDGKLRDSFWSQKLNSSFIPMAFRAARASQTTTKLCINDYSVEGINTKSNGFYELVKTLKHDSLVDCVGFQAHLEVGKLPSLEELKKNLERFVALGVEVVYSEIDIRMSMPPSAADLAQQAKDYTTIVSACVQTQGCDIVTVWGVGYQDSWVTKEFPGKGAALLFDDQYKPTAAFSAFKSALGLETTVSRPI